MKLRDSLSALTMVTAGLAASSCNVPERLPSLDGGQSMAMDAGILDAGGENCVDFSPVAEELEAFFSRLEEGIAVSEPSDPGTVIAVIDGKVHTIFCAKVGEAPAGEMGNYVKCQIVDQTTGAGETVGVSGVDPQWKKVAGEFAYTGQGHSTLYRKATDGSSAVVNVMPREGGPNVMGYYQPGHPAQGVYCGEHLSDMADSLQALYTAVEEIEKK